MKIKPDLPNKAVVIRLTAREAVAMADKLMRAAIASGHVEDGERR